MLSIVIPTFNRASNLRLALQSLAGQSDGAFEVVIADDGSTDDTRVLVAEAAASGLNVCYIHCGPNRGVRTGRSRNIGAANIDPRTTHMLMFDSDLIAPPHLVAEYKRHLADGTVLLGRVDWLAPTGHDLLAGCIASGNWAALASCVPTGVPTKQEGTFVGRELRCDVAGVPATAWREPVTFMTYAASLSLPLNACYPIALFWQAGGFDEEITGYGFQDMIFGVRVERLAPICKALATVTAFHVWHAKSVPTRFALEAQGNLDALIRLTGRLDAFANQVDWRFWWHYAADRGGTVEADESGVLWAISHCRMRRLRLPTNLDWLARLSLAPRPASSDLAAVRDEGIATATSIDAIVLARKRAAAEVLSTPV